MSDKVKMSQYCPFFRISAFDFNKNGDAFLKVGKKLFLLEDESMYLVSTATTLDLYIGSTKVGELSANGYRVV
jgi:hypothetical protein